MWIVFINRIDFVIISFAKSAIKPCPKHHFSSVIQMWKLQLRFVTQNCNTFSYSGLWYHFNSSNSLSILRRKSRPHPFFLVFSMCPPHLSFFPIPASFHQSLSLCVSVSLCLCNALPKHILSQCLPFTPLFKLWKKLPLQWSHCKDSFLLSMWISLLSYPFRRKALGCNVIQIWFRSQLWNSDWVT